MDMGQNTSKLLLGSTYGFNKETMKDTSFISITKGILHLVSKVVNSSL